MHTDSLFSAVPLWFTSNSASQCVSAFYRHTHTHTLTNVAEVEGEKKRTKLREEIWLFLLLFWWWWWYYVSGTAFLHKPHAEINCKKGRRKKEKRYQNAAEADTGLIISVRQKDRDRPKLSEQLGTLQRTERVNS